MTDDCVYEVVQTGEKWTGHDGARKFYDTLTKAVPDSEFELLDIVIGPQGVLGIANMTGTQKFPFAGNDQTGQKNIMAFNKYVFMGPGKSQIHR